MTAMPAARTSPRGWLLRLAASRRFQSLAARLPGLRNMARSEGAALFDIMAGFVNSQVLVAIVELRVLHLLQDGPQTVSRLAEACALSPDRMQVLLRAGAALGLFDARRDGRFALAVRGAAMLGVPGLEQMVLHHRALYADLADPVALLRAERVTELAQFWPYVFGAGGAADPQIAATYSNLMAESQILVAEDTLRMVDLSSVRRLMDVGGGTGAFLIEVARAHPHLELVLFDLPEVLDGAASRLDRAGVSRRVSVHPGSFREDALPLGADAISLIRVLYDHDDATVRRLVQAVFAALPPGGRIIVSEPMSGGARPDRATDVYFAIYTLAMQTGRTRSPETIADILSEVGFVNISKRKGFRSFVTSVVTARKPGL